MLLILLTLSGIVLPSALLAWAVNRWLAPVSVRLFVLLIGLVLTTLHLGVFTARMPVPLDEVVRGYPYRGVVGEVESRDQVANDTVKQILPWMKVAREEMLSGRAPIWNRYAFSGYPMIANGQSAPLSPFFLATLMVPLPKQIVAMAGLKLFVALLFGVLFLREEGAGDAAALAGSMVFAFSVYQNVYLYYQLSSVSALLPALAWAIVRSLRGGGRATHVALALVTAAAFASGHPESVFHLALAGAAVMFIEFVTGDRTVRKPGLSGLTIAYALLGVMIAAAAWLPTVELIPSSQRVDEIRTGRESSPSFDLDALWVGVHPDGFGNPARGPWRWVLNYPMVAPTFVGLIPLVLLPGALLAGSSDARARLYAVLSLIMLLLAMKWTIVGVTFDALPLASTTANDRLRFAMVFFVAVVVARRLTAIARLGPSIVDLAAGFTVLTLSIYVYEKLVLATIIPGHVLLIVGVMAFVTACLAVSMSRWRSWRLEGASTLPVVAAIVIGLELFLVNLPYNALTPGEYYAPPMPIIDAIHDAAPDESFRVLGHDWVLLPNAAAQYGLEDVRGSDPMAWAPYTRFFERIQADSQALDVLRVRRVNDTLIDFLNVRFLMTEPGFDPGEGWRQIYAGSDGSLFENDQWMRRFFAPAELLPAAHFDARMIDDVRQSVVVDDADLGKPTPNPAVAGIWMQQMSPTRFRLTVDATERTFIASSQPAMPGWQVEVDGERAEIVRVNDAFIGFRVGPGPSKVVVSYVPASWWTGVAISLLGISGLWLAGRPKRQSRP